MIGIELFQCTQEERQKWEADKKDMVLKLQELSSLLDKERKRTQHLETDKKELLSQIEKEKKASQEILGNFWLNIIIKMSISIIVYIVLIYDMNRKQWNDEEAEPSTGNRKKWFIISLGETDKATWNRETRSSLSVRARKKNSTR